MKMLKDKPLGVGNSETTTLWERETVEYYENTRA
jgi:hypothetical protein